MTRVDISNCIVFFDIHLNFSQGQVYHVKNLDRMIAIPVTKKGSFTMDDHIQKKCFEVKENSIDIFISSRQDLSLRIKKEQETEMGRGVCRMR